MVAHEHLCIIFYEQTFYPIGLTYKRAMKIAVMLGQADFPWVWLQLDFLNYLL